jgi:hypothetical protein
MEKEMGKLISFMKAMGLVALLFDVFAEDGTWGQMNIDGNPVDYVFKVQVRRSSGDSCPHIVYVSAAKSVNDLSENVYFILSYYKGVEHIKDNESEVQYLVYKHFGHKCNGIINLNPAELPQSFAFLSLFMNCSGLAYVEDAANKGTMYDMLAVARGNALPNFPSRHFAKFFANFAQYKAPDIIKIIPDIN